ncbi:F-box domain-containing protein [Mycena sanguinolenta]|uniref:F-box domain-containing protein n=1 Tax=Mycena sanguinolenta TaxID=230812 RepID=A0A8H6ZD90_9AGAR|nr:F-box domain-containing protein [Mycena sanguinolenta]
MHPVLECNNILQAIYSALEAPGRLQTLTALAITCQALSEPALDAIWEDLSDLHCILELFPQDLFVEPERRLARPILPTDWIRPRLYLSRVKTLELEWEDRVEVALKAMDPFCPNGRLLPNLCSLGCCYIPWDDLTPLRVLLHPQLKEFSVFFTPSITNLSLLSALPLMCPNLTSINLWLEGGDYSTEAAAIISGVVPALERLESLCLDVRVRALELGLLPNLTDLRLLGSMVAGSFPHLRYLAIQDVDAVSLIEMFRSVTDIDPVHLILGLSPLTTTSQMAELVCALPSVASPTSLQTLRLHPHEIMRMPENMMTADTLRELSFFRGLKTVYINWSFRPHLDDTILESLAASWPHLTNLELREPPAEDNINFTLKALLSLARHCPHLRRFYLVVDVREVPELPRIPPQGALKSMLVDLSPIQNAAKVARYLSGIFPDVQHIGSRRSEESHEQNPLWGQVLELLPESVAVRKEERGQVRAG